MKIQVKWDSGATRVFRNIDHLTEHEVLGLPLITINNNGAFYLNNIDRIVIQGSKYKGKPWVDTHGAWINYDPKGDDGLVYKCSICGELSTTESNYCPRCGSYMLADEGE